MNRDIFYFIYFKYFTLELFYKQNINVCMIVSHTSTEHV